MQRAVPALAKNVFACPYKLVRPLARPIISPPPCDVFINHRGIDTKKTISGLLFYHLSMLRMRPFLDSKNMKPGDNLYEKINTAIRGCKLGVAVFSPRYCESPFCLHELALLMESKKRVIPIFCDVKPSELRVMNSPNASYSQSELERYEKALQEAKYTVGLTFDCIKGDWSEFLQTASDAIFENLIELEGDQQDDVKSNTYYDLKDNYNPKH
ncbi:TIR domain containing protein [Parasponia andersonii]|uniref:TIR domain containing protein n=1 Tax=Parasponia andersonii TaxID=3476 RepID=A0A2P5DCK4_PARAD|nr:TIR domain containing protein [Parasponia andersonii]